MGLQSEAEAKLRSNFDRWRLDRAILSRKESFPSASCERMPSFASQRS